MTIIKMTSSQTVSHIAGVDVSDYGAVRLSKERFISANFEQYPESYAHMLIHAIQFQLKIPSLKSMERTNKRNQEKIAKRAGNKAPEPKTRRQAKRNIQSSRKRMPGFIRTKQAIPKSFVGLMPKYRNQFRIRSPEQQALKTARQTCQTEMQIWRKQNSEYSESMSQSQSYSQSMSQSISQSVSRRRRRSRRSRSRSRSRSRNQIPILSQKLVSNTSKTSKNQKPCPIYFKKKFQSHRRRMKQRWLLIKANKSALIDIYGRSILQKSCRIGIKDIRIALGLEHPNPVEDLGDFMQMVDELSPSYP